MLEKTARPVLATRVPALATRSMARTAHMATIMATVSVQESGAVAAK